MTPETLGRMKAAQVEALALPPEKQDEFLRARFAGPFARDLEIRRVGPYELVREPGRGRSPASDQWSRAEDEHRNPAVISRSLHIFREDEFRPTQPTESQALTIGLTGSALSSAPGWPE